MTSTLQYRPYRVRSAVRRLCASLISIMLNVIHQASCRTETLSEGRTCVCETWWTRQRGEESKAEQDWQSPGRGTDDWWCHIFSYILPVCGHSSTTYRSMYKQLTPIRTKYVARLVRECFCHFVFSSSSLSSLFFWKMELQFLGFPIFCMVADLKHLFRFAVILILTIQGSEIISAIYWFWFSKTVV